MISCQQLYYATATLQKLYQTPYPAHLIISPFHRQLAPLALGASFRRYVAGSVCPKPAR